MKTILNSLFFIVSVSCFAQFMPLTAEPDGGNKKASITDQTEL